MRTHALRIASPLDRSTKTSVRDLQAPYLFADSVPFSHNFDFISVLESFVDLAAEVLGEVRGVRRYEGEIARLRGELAHSVVALHRLESEVVERAVDTLFNQTDPTLEGVASDLDRAGRELCAEGRAELQANFDAHTSLLYFGIREHEKRMTSAVKRFFLRSELEATDERFSLMLSDDGYRVRLRQVVEGNITVRFEVDAKKTFWSQPRRMSDLLPGLRLGIGMRRRRFSRALSLETLALGDYFIGRIRRDGDTLDIGLRRKHETHDSLQILLSRGDRGVRGQVLNTDTPHAPFDIPAEHGDRVVDLWDAFTRVCVADKAARSEVALVSLGDQNVLRGQGAEELVDYLVAAYRPIVAELLDHGAASGELSLKRDLGDGRREERFATLSHLIDKVSALGREERIRLRKLGLERTALRARGVSLAKVRIAEPLQNQSENTNDHGAAAPKA